MAIREVKGRKRPFVVYWDNPFTKRRESKACATRQEAEKLDALVKYQLKYEREAFRREAMKEDKGSESVSLESLLYLYLKDRKLSLPCLERTMFAVKGILADFGDLELEHITMEVLKKMQERLTAAGNKWSTVRRKMGIIHAAMMWGVRQGMIASLPVFPVIPQGHHARFVPPTQDEVSALFAVAPDHLRRVIVLGYHCGMRVGQSELLRLRWNDVDFTAGIIRVPNAQKGAREPWREVPIQTALLPMLKAWEEQDMASGVDFVISFRGKPVKHIRSAWKEALQRAGITRHIRPYDLRHAFATEAIRAGTDYGTVAQLMGHSSPVMVMRHYQHVRNDQKTAAIEAIPTPAACVQNNVYKKKGGTA